MKKNRSSLTLSVLVVLINIFGVVANAEVPEAIKIENDGFIEYERKIIGVSNCTEKSYATYANFTELYKIEERRASDNFARFKYYSNLREFRSSSDSEYLCKEARKTAIGICNVLNDNGQGGDTCKRLRKSE